MKSYAVLKQTLLEDESLSWLIPFSETVDERLRNLVISLDLSQAEQQGVPRFSAYFADKYLDDLGRHLDRLLSMRRAAAELEVDAISRAVDYSLFRRNADNLEKLEKATWLCGVRDLESTEANNVATVFGESQHSLAAGFKRLSDSRNKVAESKKLGESEFRKLTTEKWKNIRQYEESLQARHRGEGQALNYEERVNRYRALIDDEMTVAIQKAKAVEAGIGRIHGISPESVCRPESNSLQILDDYVAWQRNLVTLRETSSESASASDLIIPLVQPGVDGRRRVSPRIFKTAVNRDGLVRFNLTDYFPGGFKNLIATSVGLSVDIKPVSMTMYIRAVLFPPKQKDLYSDDDEQSEMPMPIFLDGLKTTQAGVSVSHHPLHNIDPRGIWTLKLSEYMGYPDGKLRPRNYSWIRDVKVHLRVRSKLSVNPNSWKNL